MKIEQLTFTRFLAAVVIVALHYADNTFLKTNKFLLIIISQAAYFVSYFFVLSGFVMIIAYKAKKINETKYFIARIARIYPLYFCALLAVYLLNICVYKNPPSALVFLSNLLCIQSWTPSIALTLNSPSWSISVEFFFYAAFPFLVKYIYSKFNLILITICTIGLWLLSQMAAQYLETNRTLLLDSNFIYFFPLMHFNDFLIGNLAALFFLKYHNRISFELNDLILILLFLGLFLLLKYHYLPLQLHNGGLAIFFVPILIFLSIKKGIIHKILSWKPFVFLGEISFSIYILQLPVYLFYHFAFYYIGLTFNFYIYLIFLIIISSFSYLWIEIPAKKMITTWILKSIKFKTSH